MRDYNLCHKLYTLVQLYYISILEVIMKPEVIFPFEMFTTFIEPFRGNGYLHI